jgi:transcriptional regulator with XRE-family HTH domain
MVNFLSSNLRHLRKQRKLSQQQLADALGVKRSNIAAYETKNVEPRLSLLNRIATYFSVPLADLILSDLSRLSSAQLRALRDKPTGKDLSRPSVQEIRHILEKMQRAVDGFRVFYEFKREAAGKDEAEEGSRDIDNFLVFIDHVAEYQRQINNTLKPSLFAAGEGKPNTVVDGRG